jgi:anti-sigma factor RsiW
MTCEETKNLLHAYVDGELDSADSLAVKTHMRGCASCLAHGANLQGLAAAIENASLRFKAPARLNRDVRVAICAAKS